MPSKAVPITIDRTEKSITPGAVRGQDLINLSGIGETDQLLLEIDGDVDVPLAPDDVLLIKGGEAFSIGDGSPLVDDNPKLRSPLGFKLNEVVVAPERRFSHAKVLGKELKALAHELNVDLWADLDGLADEPIRDTMRVILQANDKFITAPHDDAGGETHHQIHIFVDGEKEDVTAEVMTPREIIAELAERDPAIFYLVFIHGHDRTSYQDRPDEPIHLKNGMRFQTVSLGPTPVSDGSTIATGARAFAEGLAALGFQANPLPGKDGHLVFDYVVTTGTKAGTQVKIGLVVPSDFPLTPPTGPHVSPQVFPIKTDGQHPYGAIHKDHAKAFAEALGGDWEYWSRPYSAWATDHKTVAAYMAHIWRLWDSQ